MLVLKLAMKLLMGVLWWWWRWWLVGWVLDFMKLMLNSTQVEDVIEVQVYVGNKKYTASS